MAGVAEEGVEHTPEGPDWRPLVAALANPHARRLWAQVVLGADHEKVGAGMGASRSRRAVAALVDAGLLAEVDGRLVERTDTLGRLLAAAGRPRPRGPERFLTGSGEIDRYPVDAGERRALLELVARQVLEPDEVVSEAELGERLRRFSADTATLRRYLVEAELLERTRSGSEYARVT